MLTQLKIRSIDGEVVECWALGGSSFHKAVAEAKELSRQLKQRVEYEFNEINLVVTEDTDPVELFYYYRSKVEGY
jgi:hypothetical protein